MPDNDELFLEFLRQQLLEQQSGAAHAPRSESRPRDLARVAGDFFESPHGQRFLSGLDSYSQTVARPLAFGSALLRGDADTVQHIRGGGRYEPGMITGNEWADMPVEALFSPDTWLPGVGVLGLAARRGVAGGAGMTASALQKGLRSAGVRRPLANLPGVQHEYDRALQAQARGAKLTGLTDDASAVRAGRGYVTPNQQTVDRTIELYDSFSAQLGAPSVFDVQVAVDAQIGARRRMAARELVQRGVEPAEAARLANQLPVSELPVSHWYESMARGLEGAVTAGAEPAAARATFNAFNVISGGYSPQATVPSQVTKALRTWRDILAGQPVDVAVHRGTKSTVSPIRGNLAHARPISGQKTGSFILNLQGNLGPSTFDTMELRNRFYRMIAEHAGGDVRDPAIIRQAAEHFGVMGREVAVGTGKNRRLVTITPQGIASGDITLHQVTDVLYGNIASSGRYSMFIEPQVQAARQLGYPPATGQATTWIGYGDVTNVSSFEDIYDLTTRGIRSMSGHTRLPEEELWRRFLTGQIQLREVAGSAAVMGAAAQVWFLAHQAQMDGVPYEDIIAALDGDAPAAEPDTMREAARSMSGDAPEWLNQLVSPP